MEEEPACSREAPQHNGAECAIRAMAPGRWAPERSLGPRMCLFEVREHISRFLLGDGLCGELLGMMCSHNPGSGEGLPMQMPLNVPGCEAALEPASIPEHLLPTRDLNSRRSRCLGSLMLIRTSLNHQTVGAVPQEVSQWPEQNSIWKRGKPFNLIDKNKQTNKNVPDRLATRKADIRDVHTFFWP